MSEPILCCSAEGADTPRRDIDKAISGDNQ